MCAEISLLALARALLAVRFCKYDSFHVLSRDLVDRMRLTLTFPPLLDQQWLWLLAKLISFIKELREFGLFLSGRDRCVDVDVRKSK